MIVNSGLGNAIATATPGQIVECSSNYAAYLLDPVNCWGPSFSDWQNAMNSQSLGTSLFGNAQGQDACAAVTGVSCTAWLLGAAAIVLLVKL
jgi:hypothetical protein